ncbi:MAG: response regulator [Nitrospirota bacterium]|nr:response regulator [Nitrospirota bacterium]
MSRKIMTVDDSASIRQLVSFTLKQHGYEVVEAINGAEALRKLSKEKIDMLITDINMPEMDGISLIKMVRDNPSYKFIPIIILTTESQTGKKEEAKAAGATGWIIKPFRPDQLVSAIRKVME